MRSLIVALELTSLLNAHEGLPTNKTGAYYLMSEQSSNTNLDHQIVKTTQDEIAI